MTSQPTLQVKRQSILHDVRWQVQDAHGCAACGALAIQRRKSCGQDGQGRVYGNTPHQIKRNFMHPSREALLSINSFDFLCWRRLKSPSQIKVVLCCTMLPAARRARQHHAWQQCSRLLGSWATVDPKGMSGSSPAQCYNLGEGPDLQAKVLHKHACHAVSDACPGAPNRGQE